MSHAVHRTRSAELEDAVLEQCDLSGAQLASCDLRGMTIRESYLDGLRIVGSVLGEIRVSSFAGDPARVVVESVEVWQFVSDTLDQRHPERVRLRALARRPTTARCGSGWRSCGPGARPSAGPCPPRARRAPSLRAARLEALTG